MSDVTFLMYVGKQKTCPKDISHDVYYGPRVLAKRSIPELTIESLVDFLGSVMYCPNAIYTKYLLDVDGFSVVISDTTYESPSDWILQDLNVLNSLVVNFIKE